MLHISDADAQIETLCPYNIFPTATMIMDDFLPLSGPLVNIAKAAISLILVLAFGKALREYVLIPKLTVVKDLPHLGKPRTDGRLPGTVVICGGRYAGLSSILAPRADAFWLCAVLLV